MDTLRRLSENAVAMFTALAARATATSPSPAPAPAPDLEPVELCCQAIMTNQPRTLQELLVTHHVVINETFGRASRSLLHMAAAFGSLDSVQVLIKNGADPNMQDGGGNTALHLAARNGNGRMLRMLVENGCDVNVRSHDGLTPMHWLASNGHAGPLVDVLSMGVPVDVRDMHGQTPLHLACQNGHANAVSVLLDHGADINARDSQGRSAAFFACRYGQSNCILLLISRRKAIFTETIGALVDPAVDDRMASSIVNALAGDLTTGVDVLTSLSGDLVDSCMRLLCSGSSTDDLETCVMRQGRLLALALRRGARPANGGAAGAGRSVDQLAMLEPLWTTLEEWLRLLSQEDAPRELVEGTGKRVCMVLNALNAVCRSVSGGESSPADGTAGGRFVAFVIAHEAPLRKIMKTDPKSIYRYFSFLLEHGAALVRFADIVQGIPFAERRDWFFENLGRTAESETAFPDGDASVLVGRDHPLEDSCAIVLGNDAVSMLKRTLTVQFRGEEGVGAGVRREWFDRLSREMLNPDYGLFVPSADGAAFQPNPHSHVNPDHLSYFRFAGRIVGMALYHKQTLDVHFTRSFYKHILGVPVSYADVAGIDPEYHRNLQWILDNEIDAMGLELTFSVELDHFGKTEVVELRPGGAKIAVTDENKREYVQLAAGEKMTRAIGAQIQCFVEGFRDFVPRTSVGIFNEYELELLISGLPSIDVDDWERNTEYTGYDPSSPMVEWFWRVVRSFSDEDRVMLLQFVTGSSRVPIGGFASLVGAGGPVKFTVSRLEGHAGSSRLPTASTCFNLLKLPEYESEERLRERLTVALRFGCQGYTFA